MRDNFLECVNVLNYSIRILELWSSIRKNWDDIWKIGFNTDKGFTAVVQL